MNVRKPIAVLWTRWTRCTCCTGTAARSAGRCTARTSAGRGRGSERRGKRRA
jgi:hypothetical protein